MAVTVTPTDTTGRRRVWEVEATANADASAIIAHGFAGIPHTVILLPRKAEFYVSKPYVRILDGTQIEILMSTDAGSGVAGDQITVIAEYGEVS